MKLCKPDETTTCQNMYLFSIIIYIEHFKLITFDSSVQNRFRTSETAATIYRNNPPFREIFENYVQEVDRSKPRARNNLNQLFCWLCREISNPKDIFQHIIPKIFIVFYLKLIPIHYVSLL